MLVFGIGRASAVCALISSSLSNTGRPLNYQGFTDYFRGPFQSHYNWVKISVFGISYFSPPDPPGDNKDIAS